MTILVSIEGNIGTGKTTLIKMMKKFKTSKPIIFIPEPVDEWDNIRCLEGEPILKKFYGNAEKWGFSFQMMAFISRYALLRKVIRENPESIILSERSLLTDRWVFAKMLYDDGFINHINYQIYLNWYDELMHDIKYDKIIYLQTDPECSFNRIKKRNRKGEENIQVEYIKKCHDYHEKWLIKNPLLNIDTLTLCADTDRQFDIDSYSNMVHDILDFIEK